MLTEPLGTARLRTILWSQARLPPAPESRAQRSRRDLERISTPPAGAKMAARSRRKRSAAEGTVQAGAIGGCRRGGEWGDCAASEVGMMSCNRRASELQARGLFAFPSKWRFFNNNFSLYSTHYT
jgi:hypothetical protein